MNKETIIQKAYDLLKDTIPLLNRFPKNQKFTLADRIQNQLSDLLELYIEAYYSPKSQKKTLLLKANIELEKLRHYLRLCYDFGFLNSLKLKELTLQLTEIGRMTGGWLKSL